MLIQSSTTATAAHIFPGFGDSRLPNRFWKKVRAQPNGCWQWTACRVRGYGVFQLKDRTLRAHRFSYERLRGPIPKSLQSDHLCRNRGCVNPAHIELVTCRVNLSRGNNYQRSKTHCIRGHPFDVANTYRDKNGRRYCRTCHRRREWLRKWLLRQEGG